METALLIITIILSFVVLSYILVNFLIVPLIISKKIATHYLSRKSKEDWGHRCSDETNYDQRIMWDKGLEWAKENESRKSELQIENEGYKLFGAYFDFGYNKAVIIVPGRTESYSYSYYYAPAFQQAGYNVLVIDKRGHGYSDGDYAFMGKNSSSDIIAWAKKIHDDYGIETIVLHGVCIGSSICTYTLVDKNCPSYIKGFVSDGMFTTFYVSFFRHMQEQRRPLYPYCYMAMKWAEKETHEDYIHDGPVYQVKNIKVPTLFIFTTLDKYTLHDDAEKLYTECGASKKKLVFFHKGLHSHIRVNDEEEYDKAIKDFLDESVC